MKQLGDNIFKKSVVNRELTYGIWNGLVDTVVAEIIACADFDWILIDGEHAPFDIRKIQLQLQTLSAYSSQVIVRPPVGDSVLIKNLMDIGVQNLLVPMVETAEQASQLVKDMRYPPEGIRGVGTALARASKWNRLENYFAKANSQMCLICQVETIKGLNNLEEILDIDGVDGVFIGPADLAASMGYLGNPAHPVVKEAVASALIKIKEKKKTAGVLALSEELIEFYKNKGANLLGVGVDTLVLANGAQQLRDKLK
ncbi:aldolase/citrate lyase family protein [Aquimarina sp. I32.4]|uniref:aldolase/citrate lyase family protein n=1 Tax=Aquimarina sp. I32.4 TaxID=2053903 RepID=UPI000CDEEC4B|nr:aldolase/citrate lyase family protein [Aquimarina sp. I32.4]